MVVGVQHSVVVVVRLTSAWSGSGTSRGVHSLVATPVGKDRRQTRQNKTRRGTQRYPLGRDRDLPIWVGYEPGSPGYHFLIVKKRISRLLTGQAMKYKDH